MVKYGPDVLGEPGDGVDIWEIVHLADEDDFVGWFVGFGFEVLGIDAVWDGEGVCIGGDFFEETTFAWADGDEGLGDGSESSFEVCDFFMFTKVYPTVEFFCLIGIAEPFFAIDVDEIDDEAIGVWCVYEI